MGEHKRSGLTRKTLIETGLRLLNEVGLKDLTVRRLAAELGVQSPALYWHIRTKQELLDGMADAIVVAAGMGPPGDGEPWQDWLLRRARAYRRSLLAYRDGARIVANARQLSPAAITMLDKELTALVSRGFTPAQALHTITAITQYVNGFVLQEQTEPQEDAEHSPDKLSALAEMVDGGASSTLMLAIRESGGTIREGAFEHGLRALVDGTAIVLTPPHPTTEPESGEDGG